MAEIGENEMNVYGDSKIVIERLMRKEPVLIFGARIVAKEITTCLYGEPYEANVLAHVVTDKKDNPDRFMGKDVLTISEAVSKYGTSHTIVLACMEKHLEEIIRSLTEAGYQDIIPLSFESDLWADVRWEYFKKYCARTNRNCKEISSCLEEVQIKNETSKTVTIYNARFHKDKKLSENIDAYKWEKPIQVGSALTDVKICSIRDNVGENISAKNPRYSELTAVYWIWKNDHSDYVGISHYRRHFDLNEDKIKLLADSDIDVVVTTPILNFPSVKAVYYNDHDGADWEILMQIIIEKYPAYEQAAKRVQDGCYYYAYNMMIAKKSIYDSYCKWLFDILFCCEEKCAPKENAYQNRLMGFLSERLMTIYLEQHKMEYNIVHCRKHFIFGE